MMKFDGVAQFERALLGIADEADRATRQAVAEGLLAIQRQAEANSQGRPGPNVQTGAHLHSFRTDGPRKVGSSLWEGEVGPTMPYSRRLEARFPYMAPAMKTAKRVTLPVIFRRRWTAAVRSG